MELIQDFDLFLFDLDGLLVDTEVLHFKAYREMCREKGFELTWDMDRYIREAHFKSNGLKEATYKEFPQLQEQEPNWEQLYKGKKRLYAEILKSDPIDLMPGVERFLKKLAQAGKRRAVVTNSTKDQITLIRTKVPVLESIPLWVTREDYPQAKPSPDGYLKAMATLGKPGDRVVGFEDSPRGLKALLAAEVHAVFVGPTNHPALQDSSLSGYRHVTSFEQFNS